MGKGSSHVIGGLPGLGGGNPPPFPGVPDGDGLFLLNGLIQNKGVPLSDPGRGSRGWLTVDIRITN